MVGCRRLYSTHRIYLHELDFRWPLDWVEDLVLRLPSWGGKTALEWGRAVRIVADGGGTYGFILFQIPGPTWSALLLNTIRSWTGPDTWAFGESGAVPGNDYRCFLMFDFPTDSGAARLPFFSLSRGGVLRRNGDRIRRSIGHRIGSFLDILQLVMVGPDCQGFGQKSGGQMD